MNKQEQELYCLRAERAELVAALRLAADDLLDGDYEIRSGYASEIHALLAKLGEGA